MIKRICQTSVSMLLVLCGAAHTTAAPITFSFDTLSLVGLGDFGFDLQLIDGDSMVNSTVTLDLFDFGGGAPVGVPKYIGGASGSLLGSVMLTDSAFFNGFTQNFSPGANLGFRLDITTTALGIPQPEGFQLSILDASGFPIASTDPSGLNALIFGELSAGGTSFQQFAVALAAVPEPSTLVLLTIGGAGVLLRRRLRGTSGCN